MATLQTRDNAVVCGQQPTKAGSPTGQKQGKLWKFMVKLELEASSYIYEKKTLELSRYRYTWQALSARRIKKIQPRNNEPSAMPCIPRLCSSLAGALRSEPVTDRIDTLLEHRPPR